MSLGILFLHGYTGGRYELLPLIQYLKDNHKFEIIAPEYPGHGEKLAIKHTNEIMWFKKAKEAYEELNSKVDEIIIIGFSMGAVIAGLLAKEYQINKIVFIAPAFNNINISYLVKNTYKYINNFRQADFKLLEFMMKRSLKVNFKSFLSFKKLQQKALYVPEQIEAKTLIIHGKIDGLVPIEEARLLNNRIKNSKLVEIERGPHEICLSNVNNKVFKEIESFIF